MKNTNKFLFIAAVLVSVAPAHGMFRTFAGLRSFARPMLRATKFAVPAVAAAASLNMVEARINVKGSGTFQENSKFKAEHHEAVRKGIAQFAASASTYAQCVKHENNAHLQARNAQEFAQRMAPHAAQCDPLKETILIDPLFWQFDHLGCTPFMSDLHIRTAEKFNPWEYAIDKLDLDVTPIESEQAKAEFNFQASVTQKTMRGLAHHLYKMKRFNKEYAQCIKNGKTIYNERCQALGAIYPSPRVTFEEFEIDVDLKESNEAV